MKSSLLPIITVIFSLAIKAFGAETNQDAGGSEQRTVVNSCTEKLVNGKLTVSCVGTDFSRIPLPKDAGISDPEKVQVFIMEVGNHIQILESGQFREYPNVDTLRLVNIQIRGVDKTAFQELDALMELDLRDNQIVSLDMEIFNTNTKLKILTLKGNPIHQLTGTQFGSLPLLTTLDMSHCNLPDIPVQAFQKLSGLQTLHLEHNRLRRLDWEVLRSSNKLSHLSLKYNQWNCDCHMKFLRQFLSERKLNITSSIECVTPHNVPLAHMYDDELICSPVITGIVPSGVEHTLQSNDVIVMQGEVGSNIGFQCSIEAYPEPDIFWLKNGRNIDDEVKGGKNMEDDEEGGHPHYTVQDKTLIQTSREDFRYRYSKLLKIYNANENDVAEYKCIARSSDSKTRAVSTVFLNFTNLPYPTEGPIEDAGMNNFILLISLIGLLSLLVLLLLIIGILIWRKKEKERQEKLKRDMMTKFKDSEIVLDDNFAPPTKKETLSNPATTPLLPQNEQERLRTQLPYPLLPDIAQNNANIHNNLSPLVFSPRLTPNSEMRHQFFAANVQNQKSNMNDLERPQRPSSAMSFNRYNSPAHNRLQYSTLPHPRAARPMFPLHSSNGVYALTKTWGSTQSLVYVASAAPSPRPMLMRQFSGPTGQPHGAFMRMPPSGASSMVSEPYQPYQKPVYGYVTTTLPRNFRPVPASPSGRPTSPTESLYSTGSTFSYASTLPRKVNRRMDPHTGVIYDTVGKRTTADGGSNLSLNKLDNNTNKLDMLQSISQGLASPSPGRVMRPSGRSRTGSIGTPGGSIRSRDFFSFEPIQEVEGSEDMMSQLPSNAELDKMVPTLQPVQNRTDSEPHKYKRKRPPLLTKVPPRVPKPTRTFDYSSLKRSKEKYDYDEALDGDREQVPPPVPSSPCPKPSEVTTSIENIIENEEGTQV